MFKLTKSQLQDNSQALQFKDDDFCFTLKTLSDGARYLFYKPVVKKDQNIGLVVLLPENPRYRKALTGDRLSTINVMLPDIATVFLIELVMKN